MLKFNSLELLQLIKFSTVSKIFNALKLYISFEISKIIGKPFMWGLPFSLSVEPVNKCNLACNQCPTGLSTILRPKGKLTFLNYTQIIEQVAPHLLYLQLYLQGEPFLHPELPEMIAYANKRKICTLVSTNGHFLSAEKCRQIVASGLTRLVVSLDGATAEVYEKYRVGGNFEKVLHGIRNMVEAKNNAGSNYPIIELQFIVFRANEHQIKEIQLLGKLLGTNLVSIKSAQIYDFEENSDLIPTIVNYARYFKNKNGNWQIKSKLKNSCWRMWHNPVVDTYGNIMPCCFDKNGNFSLGNLLEKSLKEVWYSESYKAFRRKIFTGRKQLGMCRNCTEGLKL